MLCYIVESGISVKCELPHYPILLFYTCISLYPVNKSNLPQTILVWLVLGCVMSDTPSFSCSLAARQSYAHAFSSYSLSGA